MFAGKTATNNAMINQAPAGRVLSGRSKSAKAISQIPLM